MGQSCGCNPKFCDDRQLTQTSNIEPYPCPYPYPNTKSLISEIQSPNQQLDITEYKLEISQEFYIFRLFLQDSLAHNKTIKQQIYDICWDIQYFILTATNAFSFDIENWKSFINNIEREKIIKSFCELQFEDQSSANYASDDQESSDKYTSQELNQQNFEKWLEQNKLLNQDHHHKKQTIYINLLEKK